MTQRIPLTGRQRVVFDFIREYIEKHGVAPTFEEMAKHFGRTLGTLHEIVEHLERRGWITRNGEHKSQRNIAIVGPDDAAAEIAGMLENDAITLARFADESKDAADQKIMRAVSRRLVDYARTLRT